jgi:hypothetical protein
MTDKGSGQPGKSEREGAGLAGRPTASVPLATPTDDLLPIERRWLAEDPHDPRATCPNREQHAYRVYGQRWTEGFLNPPRLDGKSVARSHKQLMCEGCRRWMIWLPRSPS